MPTNFLTIIHRIWALLKDWPQSFTSLRHAFFTQIRFCMTCRMERSLKVCRKSAFSPTSGMSALRPATLRNMCQNFKKRTWKLTSTTKTHTTKSAKYFSTFPSRTLKRATNSKSHKNPSMNSNLHIDPQLRTFSSLSTKTKRLMPTWETRLKWGSSVAIWWTGFSKERKFWTTFPFSPNG